MVQSGATVWIALVLSFFFAASEFDCLCFFGSERWSKKTNEWTLSWLFYPLHLCFIFIVPLVMNWSQKVVANAQMLCPCYKTGQWSCPAHKMKFLWLCHPASTSWTTQEEQCEREKHWCHALATHKDLTGWTWSDEFIHCVDTHQKSNHHYITCTIFQKHCWNHGHQTRACKT